MELDYSKLGLKVGFEIHQELNTHKLFCNCPSELKEDEPKLAVMRKLRPTQSEMGEVDRAALAEAIKGKGFNYQVHTDSVCLVELDEEPPHPVNEEALNIALELATLLNAKPVDEVHVMRKIVIDGSNTAGFQRTMLVATNGTIDAGGKSFRIPTICLEEDAARKMGEGGEHVDYRLDRLGIPLLEIATGPDFSDPHTPAKAALYLGQILRVAGKVKRGIGTIRQDVNISIAGGARQEIKGVQELALISAVIEREVHRQLALIDIREELKNRGASEVEKKFFDVSGLFSSTESKVVQNAMKTEGVVLAVTLRKFSGLLGRELQPGRRFGTELSDYARLYGKVGGLFHTDEMPAYGISQEEVRKLREATDATEGDAVVFIADLREKAEAGLKAVVDRANQAIEGVPEETRRALLGGNSEFMRPLPGASRMYPETDIPPITITSSQMRKIRAKLPELPADRRDRLMKQYKLSRELAWRMTMSENLKLFEEIVAKTRADPTLIATTLEETIVSLRREGVRVEGLQNTDLIEIFKWVKKGKMAKEALPDVMRLVARGIGVLGAVEQLKITAIGGAELEKLVADVVASNIELVREKKKDALSPLMGLVMEKARGRADGKLVHDLLEKELKKASAKLNLKS
ncbi:MAG: Glu-tRNA(Gln) amidotransferase subunit GatE [Candidatus Hadarchaeota archaeon]